MGENKSAKRIQVDKDKTRIFVIISIAAVITVASLMIAKGLWSHGNYLSKVASTKSTAKKQLEKNKAAVATLTEAYDAFVGQEPNLLSGSIDGTTDRDGDNGSLILDALPSKYDFPAVAASLEKLLSGYAINSITGTDDSAAQEATAGGGPVEIPFSLSVGTNYDGLKRLTDAFNRSIRPFHIVGLELSGANATLDVTVQGKTFYQPESGLQITRKQVR